MRNSLIPIGNFFFKYRNAVFPIFLIAAFVAVPPSPTFLGRRDLEPLRDVIAILIMLSGLLLRLSVIGFAYIRRGGKEKKVYAKELVSSGMFGVCRNPLYVGNMLICTGVFVLNGNWWLAFGAVALFFFMYHSIVSAEENFLSQKFGAAYQAYCATVPRWGLKLSRFTSATAGMRFDLGKALFADYNPILNCVLIVSGVELYEELAYTQQPRSAVISIYVAIISATVLGTVGVHYYKKYLRTPAH